MKFKLAAVTPLHIGSGRALEPFEYVVHNSQFIRLDQNKAFTLALENHQDFPDKYSEWLQTTSQLIDATRDNQQQARLRNNFNFMYFCNTMLKDTALANRLPVECAKYTLPMPFGRGDKKQVDELLRSANNEIYIPGSSLKGSIRTALVAKVVSSYSAQEKGKLIAQVSKLLSDQRVSGRQMAEMMETTILVAGYSRSTTDTPLFDDIKFDIMKFLRISDARPINVNAAMVPVNMYLFGKPPQGQTNAHEVIMPGSEFLFDMSFDILRFRHIVKESEGKPLWLEAEKKFRRLFNIPENKKLNQLTEAELLNTIKGNIQWFYNRSLINDAKWSDEAIEPTAKAMQKSWDKIPSDKVIMKIGKGSGFPATTVFSSFDLKNSAEKEFINKLFAKFRIGYPRTKTPGDLSPPNVTKFPKSRKLTAQSLDAPVAPFGWCVILNEDENYKAPEWNPVVTAGIAAVPPKPKVEMLSEEKYMEQNSKLKFKVGDTTEAKFVQAAGKQVTVQLLIPGYETEKFVISYGSPQLIEEKGIVKVKINQLSGGRIKGVTFAGFI